MYLLDTQVALRLFLGEYEKLFQERFSTEETFAFHQVSTWEVQIKYSLGKLPLPSRPETFLSKVIAESGLRYVTLDDASIFFLDRLPPIHRDPFERLLIAYALTSGCTIITTDKTFEKYPVRLEVV